MALLYINNNGEVLKNEGAVLASANRGHLYGDGLFESIRVKNGKPINLEPHILRMLEGAIALKMRVPSFFTVSFFEERIMELLSASSIHDGGKVRISLDRVSGGTYKPTSNEVTYLIEVYPLDTNDYELNQRGWEIDLFTTIRKHKNRLSNYKTKNG